MSAAVTLSHVHESAKGSNGVNPTARTSPAPRNPEVLSRVSQIPLLLQMHNRGEATRAATLAEGVLQRASMYVMNQAYDTSSHPISPDSGLRQFLDHNYTLLGLTRAADLLKFKALEVRRGR